MNTVLPRWMNDVSLKLALALGVTLLTVACASEPRSAAGGDAAAAGATTLAANEAVPNEDKLECRNERVTGSNLPRKVCRTVATWNALQRAERRMSDEYTRQTSQAEGLGNISGGPSSPTAVGPLGAGGTTPR